MVKYGLNVLFVPHNVCGASFVCAHFCTHAFELEGFKNVYMIRRNKEAAISVHVMPSTFYYYLCRFSLYVQLSMFICLVLCNSKNSNDIKNVRVSVSYVFVYSRYFWIVQKLQFSSLIRTSSVSFLTFNPFLF